MITDQIQAEKSGPQYSLAPMLVARDRTREATREIAKRIKVGMTESQALEMSELLLRDMGVVRKWHGTKIRFGENTLLTYGFPSKPNTVLQENDIFFIDLGPVWEGFEGDYGATFVVGHDSEMTRAASECRLLFDLVKERWHGTGETGRALYEFAASEAQKLGWILNLHQSSGHRLSDFPHTLHFKGALADLAFPPSPGLWVLEISIRHPTRPFGAFYEDLLVRGN